ncbi:MAG: hypothetical protein MRY83_03170, partial [Flavobacteriales bacterium]|nr:hypothetical protein [Flavobacteriales bacterium]
KIFLTRTNSSKDRKDIQLFDTIKKGKKEISDDLIFKSLYKEGDKNSYYRLKNRLLGDIGKSLSLLHFDANDHNNILYNLGLARLFQRKRQYPVVKYYLSKAEKKAEQIQDFEILDIIYSEFIKLSHEYLNINPEIYIEKRQQNKLELNRLREIDDILAVLIYRIKISQNLTTGNYDIIELLKKTIDDFSSSTDLKKSSTLRIKIYQALSRIFLQQHDYKSLEEYLEVTFREFDRDGLFNRNNHDLKLQMITYYSNSLYKNGKFNESLKWSNLLHEEMLEYNKLHFDKYLFYYYLGQMYNYSGLKNHEKAIEILHEAENNNSLKKTPINILFVYLQLALQYSEMGSNKSASKYIVKMKIHDSFGTLDIGFRLKIRVAELIIRYDLSNYDYVEDEIVNIKKEFKKILSDQAYLRQKQMLEILDKLIYSHNVRVDKPLMKLINNVINSATDQESFDQDILSYNEWLKTLIT